MSDPSATKGNSSSPSWAFGLDLSDADQFLWLYLIGNLCVLCGLVFVFRRGFTQGEALYERLYKYYDPLGDTDLVGDAVVSNIYTSILYRPLLETEQKAAWKAWRLRRHRRDRTREKLSRKHGIPISYRRETSEEAFANLGVLGLGLGLGGTAAASSFSQASNNSSAAANEGKNGGLTGAATAKEEAVKEDGARGRAAAVKDSGKGRFELTKEKAANEIADLNEQDDCDPEPVKPPKRERVPFYHGGPTFLGFQILRIWHWYINFAR